MILGDNMLLQLLGFDRSSAPADAELEFGFMNRPESWGVFVFIGIAALLFWLTFRLYRREIAGCPRWVKHSLAVVRVFVLAVLLFLFLDPAVTYTKSRSLRPAVSVLVDTSQSMANADRYDDDAAARAAASALGKTAADLRAKPPTREELVQSVLSAGDWRLLRDLDAKGRLRVLDFSHRVADAARIPLTVDAKKDDESGGASEDSDGDAGDIFQGLAPVVADGSGTDLARALREAMSDKLTSAVIAFTDGQHNGSESLEETVAEAKRRGIPLFFVGVGDPLRPVNLSVSELYADPQVWKADPFEVQAILRAQGIENESVTVELIETAPPAGADGESTAEPFEEKVIGTQEAVVSAENPQARLVFTHTFEEPGAHWLTVRAKAMEDERNTDDNAPSAPIRVNVLDNRARVLIVAGAPNWEYRALTRLFMREPTIDVSCWLQSLDEGRQQQGNTEISELPVTQEKLFDFDVVLLLDPDPAQFDEAWIELLGRFVREHSGGMLYMPGPAFSGQFLGSGRTAGIRDLLPVSLGDVGDVEVNSLLSSNDREWPLQIVASNADQPVMRFFADTEQTIERWKTLAGIYWSFPALDAKPGSRILMEHSDPTLRRREVSRPLLVTGQLGSGRTIYLGFDGTWRWRTAGVDAEYFKRFWVQTTRYLIEGRTLAGKRRGVIETERSRYEVGDRVRLTARLREINYDPFVVESIDAELLEPGREPGKLTFLPVPNEKGTYTAIMPVSVPGQYVGAEMVSLDKSVPVTLPVKEARSTWLDKPALQELATMSGGKYFDIDQTAALAVAVPDRIRHLETRSSPIPIWDTNRVLILLVTLLTLEWAMRKRYKLL
jgi:hypothetical protein